MGLMDNLRKLTHPYSDTEDDYDDFDDELMDEEEEAEPAPRRTAPTYGRTAAPVTDTASRTGVGRVVNINSGTQLQVVLVKPERFDQVDEIADHLRDKKAVVLNLETTQKDVARRLVDFLSGCAYALDGKIKKIAISTYIITPYNVDIVGDLIDELENNGLYL